MSGDVQAVGRAGESSAGGLTATVAFDGVSKTFESTGPAGPRRVRALEDVSFSIRPGEFVSILGPSGCGKTTCLRILAGLTEYDAGSVTVKGRLVRGPGRERAVVFQTFNLLPWKTVLQNAEFGLKLQGMPKRERHERARQYLDLVGLNGFEEHYPHQLSGGMQQRVGIARALATDPEVLLMDEPFASIDAQTRELLQGELLRILDRAPKTVMFITHAIDEAVYLSDRVLVFRPRPGAVTTTYEIDLPKPRYEHSIRAMPRFVEIREAAWESLRAGIEQASRAVSAPPGRGLG